MDTTDFAEKLRSYRNNGNCEICGHPATRWMYDDYLRVDNPQHASQIAGSALLLCDACVVIYDHPGADWRPPVQFGSVADLLATLPQEPTQQQSPTAPSAADGGAGMRTEIK